VGETKKQQIGIFRYSSFFSKNLIWILCITVIFLQIFQIIYFKREAFLTQYDTSYWKERFEHSQWQLPLTQRIIGDDGLYAYNGYALFNGVSPYTIVAQVPPVGKYILGISIILFNNASYSALAFSIGSLIVFYLIARKILYSPKKAILVTAFFSLDPFFFTQLWPWMLDIFQLFFLLTNIYFLILFFESKGVKKKIIYLSVSGIALAFFSQTKVPILLPLLLVVELGYLCYLRKLKEALLFVFVFVCAFLLSNIQFFLEGKSFLEFMKFQKYVFVFYSQSKIAANNFAIWQTLFFGKVPQVATGTLIGVREWWPALSLIGLIGIIQSVLFIGSKSVNYIWKIIAVFLCGSVIIFTLVPFYSRYLILLIPFLYLIFFKSLFSIIPDKKNYVLLPLLFLGLFYTFYYLQPKPRDMLSTFYHSFENRYFQDIYAENLSQSSKQKIDRLNFSKIAQTALNDAGIGAISIQEKSQNIMPFSSSGKVFISIIYKTKRLGGFEEDKILYLKKENGEWKIKWDWNLIFNSFEKDDQVISSIIPGRRGSIVSAQGNTIAEDASGNIIMVNPGEIDRGNEEKMLEFLSKISGQEKVRLQAEYLDNAMKGDYVPVSTIFVNLTDEEKLLLKGTKGIRLEEYPNRISYDNIGGKLENAFYYECCSRIYSRYNYVGISGLEKVYEDILRGEDGGKIILADKFGEEKRILLEKNRKMGQDIVN
jgi:hypothetical protein